MCFYLVDKLSTRMWMTNNGYPPPEIPVENLSTANVENLYRADILGKKCGKLIHHGCGKLISNHHIWTVWKTYPQQMWIKYIELIYWVKNVENLSTFAVDKSTGPLYVDSVENLSTMIVENLYRADILGKKCGKLIHHDCGKLIERKHHFPHRTFFTAGTRSTSHPLFVPADNILPYITELSTSIVDNSVEKCVEVYQYR